MGWKFDRLGDHFPLVSANWLRSKLVIDWQHVPGRGQYTRVATRREPYWPTLQMLERFIYLPKRADLFATLGFVPVKWHRVARGRIILYTPARFLSKLCLDTYFQLFLRFHPPHF